VSIRKPNVSGFVILHPLPYLPFRVFFFSSFIQNTRKVTEEGYQKIKDYHSVTVVGDYRLLRSLNSGWGLSRSV
jgi:hypothetical protein